MRSNLIRSLLAIFVFSTCKLVIAGPWYTGPLLAPAGHTIPKGHTNLEIYGFYTNNDGFYDKNWKLIHTPANQSTTVNPIFSHGLTDWMDLQFTLPYSYSNNLGARNGGISDTAVTLGFQLLEQKGSRWRPDLRFTVQEVLPSGRYDLLNPANNGTDATGLGSYQTGLALNFQHLMPFTDIHYLRTRLSLAYMHAADVRVHGLNSYGGSLTTDGTIDPGDVISADLAGEFSLTQHWVAVMEGYVANRGSTRFSGNPGLTASGLPAPIGHAEIDQITIAPALEYNFNENIGLIGGVWTSLSGKDSSNFQSYILALNAYW